VIKMHLRRMTPVKMLVTATMLLVAGCTSTQVRLDGIQQAAQPIRLEGARVAVLHFGSAPGQPETGAAARDLATTSLVEKCRATIVSPSSVEVYLRDHPLVPSDQDRAAMEVLGVTLGADVVMWGAVNQFTPYRFDRLMPATPPYVEITLQALRIGGRGIARATGRKQGSVPTTIWSRQPTFDDVAREAIVEVIGVLK
jgi:hypothetical protein